MTDKDVKADSSNPNLDESTLSDERQNKLLRLLGGKKADNVNAANEWVQKSRSVEEETTLKQGLESQYNASLNLRLSGKARRHEGIGFEDDQSHGNKVPNPSSSSSPSHSSSNDNQSKDSATVKKRDRSRSPLRKDSKDESTDNKNTHNGSAKSPKVIDKKNFYMQFTKAKED